MIYLMIQGGCGNQFFQYAFARALQEQTGQKLVIDWRYVKNSDYLWNNGENVLQFFNTQDFEDGNASDIWQFKLLESIWKFMFKFHFEYFKKRTYRFYQICSILFNNWGLYLWDANYKQFKIAKTKNIVIQGYFESAKYFEKLDDKIREELTVKDKYPTLHPKMLEIIKSTNSVCVTIKRMDVDNNKTKNIYDYNIDYFFNAIYYIKSKQKDVVFFIFSDDIAWCKEHLKELENKYKIYYECGTDPIYEKIRLMSSCKHFIIHNSTFSWWAQHLSSNKEKMVIAPAKWMKRDDQPIDIYMKIIGYI